MSSTELRTFTHQPEDAAVAEEETSDVPEDILSDTPATALAEQNISRARASLIVSTVAGVSFLNTLGSGLLIVGLPRIAAELHLANNLLLWPASVFALMAGCTLLASGAIADVVGNC